MQRYLLWMSKQKISLLLPGSFFEQDVQKKLEYLNNKNLQSIFVFDQTVNPADENLQMYEVRKSINILQNYEERIFNIGTLVLNINKRNIDDLTNEYINPFMAIDGFKLGLGLGDDRYEKNSPNFFNNLDDIVSYVVEKFDFTKDDREIFLGGKSDLIFEVMRKYSVGINQWFGSEESFRKKREIYEKLEEPIGSISLCLNKDFPSKKKINIKNVELIYIIKESSSEIFYSQVDKIL